MILNLFNGCCISYLYLYVLYFVSFFPFTNAVYSFFVLCKLQDESGNRIDRDGKPLIHTDGTGFISEDLALLCPKDLLKRDYISKEYIEVCDFMF